jgi:UDPglucose--hexose-1-phosphate uridylyltransferase
MASGDLTHTTREVFSEKCTAIAAERGSRAALEFLHDTAKRTGYVQEERLKLDLHFAPQKLPGYGCSLRCSINCSKPEFKAGEKRPATVLAPGAKCVLCSENVCFKPGLLAWDIKLSGREFFVQSPPYPYSELHSVLIEKEHTPQCITTRTVLDLLDGARQFPGMCICSNTDLSGTGASVLEHKHYQMVAMRLPICDAEVDFRAQAPSSTAEVSVEFLKYPCAALRLRASEAAPLANCAEALLQSWRGESIAAALEQPVSAQTMSFVCTQTPAGVELVLIPRTQGRLTCHTMRCIKAEFVGILEMAGFGILPGRLAEQLSRLVLQGAAPEGDLSSFANWIDELALGFDATSESLMESRAAAHAVYASLQRIIVDNGAFPQSDKAKARLWLEEAGFSVDSADA